MWVNGVKRGRVLCSEGTWGQYCWGSLRSRKCENTTVKGVGGEAEDTHQEGILM